MSMDKAMFDMGVPLAGKNTSRLLVRDNLFGRAEELGQQLIKATFPVDGIISITVPRSKSRGVIHSSQVFRKPLTRNQKDTGDYSIWIKSTASYENPGLSQLEPLEPLITLMVRTFSPSTSALAGTVKAYVVLFPR